MKKSLFLEIDAWVGCYSENILSILKNGLYYYENMIE